MKKKLQKFFSNNQIVIIHGLIAGFILGKAIIPFNGWMLFLFLFWVGPMGFLFNYLANGE